MSNPRVYTKADLQRRFPKEESCLDLIFYLNHVSQCHCGGEYSPHKGRKKFQCSKCRRQIAPMAGTIFHKSTTPLLVWFYAVLIYSNQTGKISPTELQRELLVSYKCARRILALIREAEPKAREITGIESNHSDSQMRFFGLLEGIIQCLPNQG